MRVGIGGVRVGMGGEVMDGGGVFTVEWKYISFLGDVINTLSPIGKKLLCY